MQPWRRYLWGILAIPLLVIADAHPEPGVDRRYARIVATLQWLLGIYLAACIVISFWNGPGPGWPRSGFGLVADSIFGIQEWLAVAVIGSVGTLCLLGTVIGSFQVVSLLVRGRRTMATVVSDTNLDGCDPESIRRYRQGGSFYPAPPATVYDPKFRFTDRKGQTHTVSGALARCCGTYQVGQEVPLIYLPGRPGTFVVDRFADKWAPALLFFIAGVLLLLPCLVLVFGFEPFFRHM